ncbi:unnamed protein product [Cylicocyclus nassatus]|uniref:Uncharacterized protein n=1 Tax=Cylicocyclus nassatus TaxID=53992 RepID=A0AA36DLK4_CYLNA|nr:unnamed protein product [Cylicocyclus nassatus]
MKKVKHLWHKRLQHPLRIFERTFASLVNQLHGQCSSCQPHRRNSIEHAISQHSEDKGQGENQAMTA